jgi:hypothetical protein
MATGTYSYVYDVNVTSNIYGTYYSLIDSRPTVGGFQSLVNPQNDANGVRVTDLRDTVSDDRDVLGDRANDAFRISGNAVLDGVYTFVGTATSGAVSGFVAKAVDGTFIFVSNEPASSSDLSVSPGSEFTICFMPGTAIATPTGAVAVETLSIGDLVLTSDGRAAPVRWIGRQTVSTLFADETRLPVRITAGALGDNLPVRDLLVSNDHALLVEGVLVQAGALINGSTIVRERNVPPVFTYYHVELDDHSLILAENVPAETFVDNVERYAFDNWAEHQALYPNGRSVAEMDLPRVKAHRQLPLAVRRLIASRVPAETATAA